MTRTACRYEFVEISGRTYFFMAPEKIPPTGCPLEKAGLLLGVTQLVKIS
jgi:hypothetical protein